MKLKYSVFIFFIASQIYSQDLTWTGNTGNTDFFDENNWIDNNNSIPVNGTLEPALAIDLDLNIQNTIEVDASGLINLGSGSLSLTETSLNANAISNGNLEIQQGAYIELSDPVPFQGSLQIDLTSSLAWIKTSHTKPNEINSTYLNIISVNQQLSVYQNNLRLDNYYSEGCIIRSMDADTPLEIFSDESYAGNTAGIGVDNVYASTNIPNGLNNQINSFQLKKGYMVTFAVNDDGTGKSKNYIASEADLSIDELPNYLKNSISFIRVLPWNWVQKKGRSGTNTIDLENTWYYLWSNSGDSTIDIEYAPMSWGAGGADDDADIALYQSKYKATHLLGFNESDNCNDQSGQFNNLCQIDVAVGFYRNLMKSGLRLVSPSGRENAPFGWLKDFYDEANEEEVRMDVIGVHWYDWGSNPSNSPNADPNAVFQRFVNYLQNVYDLYGLPIWITEFNANPNRTNAVNYQFMQLALPYLESLDYVERYVWFQPNSDVADYYDENGNLTNVGTFYKNQISTPAIPEPFVNANNNLDNYEELVDPTGENIIYNGFFETQNLTGWSGSNIAILNNAYEGESAARIMANPGQLYQDIEVEPNTIYDLSFYTRWFVAPNNPIEVKILNTDNDEVIASQLMGTSTNWNLIEMSFTTPLDVNNIRFIIEKGNEPGWFIDNALLLKVQNLGDDVFENQNDFQIYPNPSSGLVYLHSSNDIKAIDIYDIYGRLVYSSDKLNPNKIDLGFLEKGLYLLKLKDNSGKQSTRKIILK